MIGEKTIQKMKAMAADQKAPGNEGGGMTEHPIPLCAEIDRLRARVKELEESRDSWKREWRLSNAGLDMAEKRIAELEAEGERLKAERDRLREAIKPTTVLCGSSRFTDIMAVCAWFIERDEHRNTMGLHLLPGWYCKEAIPDHLAEAENCSADMDALHLTKIDMADEIFVVNFQDYIGKSTAREVEYAIAKCKRVRWFTHDPVGVRVLEILEQSIKRDAGKEA